MDPRQLLQFVLVVCVSLVCIRVQANETGVSAKFRNLTNRKLRVFWVDHQDQPYLNGIIPPGKETSFASYVGHRFFWAEMHGPDVPLQSKGALPDDVTVTVNDEFLLYTITDYSTTDAAMEAELAEVQFMKDYRERTGRNWISIYPRDPPIFAMYPAKRVGDTYPITVDGLTRKWKCEDQTNPDCLEAPETLHVKVLATQPRAFVVENFMSDWEVEFVKDYHRPIMQRSTTGNGENMREETRRTSKSSRMYRASYPLADTLYRRLAVVLNMSQRLIHNDYNAEPINIVHYTHRQEYTPHFDAGSDGESQQSRFISALLYFNTPDAGGHTSFPKAEPLEGSDVDYLRLPAKKGNLMFFYDLLEDGNMDEYSLHAGEPVEAGEKWIGAAWIWEPARSGGVEKVKEIKEIYRQFAQGEDPDSPVVPWIPPVHSEL